MLNVCPCGIISSSGLRPVLETRSFKWLSIGRTISSLNLLTRSDKWGMLEANLADWGMFGGFLGPRVAAGCGGGCAVSSFVSLVSSSFRRISDVAPDSLLLFSFSSPTSS